MTTQALQLELAKTRYVVRPKVLEKETSKQELLKNLDKLGDRATDHWSGPADAVAEIRAQRVKSF